MWMHFSRSLVAQMRQLPHKRLINNYEDTSLVGNPFFFPLPPAPFRRYTSVVTTSLFWWTLSNYNHFEVVFKSCFSHAIVFE
jgi:hypothetical protein